MNLPPLLDGYEIGYTSGYEDGYAAAWPDALEKAYRVMHQKMLDAYGEDYIPRSAYLADVNEEERAA